MATQVSKYTKPKAVSKFKLKRIPYLCQWVCANWKQLTTPR